ncbi:MAG: RIP metalloprotease RseP, partial [Proteobacteria bacterium]|nr:RIP metalloprotease RseP [Pseudomonadota bacterium]
GPLANLISAFILGVISIAVWGATVPVNLPVIGQVIPGYPAEKGGMKLGDKVLSVDGSSVKTWEELSSIVRNSQGKELSFEVERAVEGGSMERKVLTFAGVQERSELEFLDSSFATQGYKVGISAAAKRVDVGVLEAVQLTGYHIYKLTKVTLRGVLGLVTGAVSLKNIGGPIFIFGESMRSAKQGIAALLDFMVFLSVSLAVFNLLPIPVLDGGHLVFFAIEALKGKPISLRAMELATQVGMVFILALTVLAVGNDMLRLWNGGG